MARETRRQRRDARRAAGEETPARTAPRPVPATPEATVAVERPRRGGFVRESIAELKKVDWPSRRQTFQGVVVVIIACTIVGAYLWGLDQIFRPLVDRVLL